MDPPSDVTGVAQFALKPPHWTLATEYTTVELRASFLDKEVLLLARYGRPQTVTRYLYNAFRAPQSFDLELVGIRDGARFPLYAGTVGISRATRR